MSNFKKAVGSVGETRMAECPSILLILPYFGPLPPYADLFFRSCRENQSINWLLITDQEIAGNRLPPNIALKRATFGALKKTFDDALGFETMLPTPYKVSDFRPAYGVLFAEDVSPYDFWGHCDMDMIFGDVRKFVTNDLLQKYHKVLIHGHLSLYRNCEEANNYFRLEAPGIDFRDVFTSKKSRAFDEFGGMRRILDHHKIPFFRDDSFLADIDRNFFRMRTIQPPNYRHQCFYWEKGKIFREFWDGAKCNRQEYLYIHLQKRPMSPPLADLAASDAWYVAPRQFVSKTSAPVRRSEMDRLNPGNVFFDLKRQVLSILWRLQWTITQRRDPWPRRVRAAV